MDFDLDMPPIRARVRRRRNRLTRMLGLTVGFALAFHLGVRADQAFRSAAPAAPTMAAHTAGATTGVGAPEASGLTGRVEAIDGDSLYVHDGERLVKVRAGTGSLVSRAAPASLGDIQPGHEVTVEGNRQPDGSLSAVTLMDTTGEEGR